MSSSIETRIERLEQQEAGVAGATALRLQVSFVSPDGAKPVDQVTGGRGQIWQRAEGETEQEFVGRAWASAGAPPRGCAQVLFAGAAQSPVWAPGHAEIR